MCQAYSSSPTVVTTPRHHKRLRRRNHRTRPSQQRSPSPSRRLVDHSHHRKDVVRTLVSPNGAPLSMMQVACSWRLVHNLELFMSSARRRSSSYNKSEEFELIKLLQPCLCCKYSSTSLRFASRRTRPEPRRPGFFIILTRCDGYRKHSAGFGLMIDSPSSVRWAARQPSSSRVSAPPTEPPRPVLVSPPWVSSALI